VPQSLLAQANEVIEMRVSRMSARGAVERSPKVAPTASAVRGIATIRDRVIFGNSRAQG
jgi:hypothetical protein